MRVIKKKYSPRLILVEPLSVLVGLVREGSALFRLGWGQIGWLEWVGSELICWLVNIDGFLAGIDLIAGWLGRGLNCLMVGWLMLCLV